MKKPENSIICTVRTSLSGIVLVASSCRHTTVVSVRNTPALAARTASSADTVAPTTSPALAPGAPR